MWVLILLPISWHTEIRGDHIQFSNGCQQCMVRTFKDNRVTNTLVYYSDFECKGNVTQCVYGNATYHVCQERKGITCYNPLANSVRARINICQKGVGF